MSTTLSTVTLSDLGTYQVTIAADTPGQAKAVAKEVLWEEAAQVSPGLSTLKRETEAEVVPATERPFRNYRVRATYRLDFALTVPAGSREEAARHARRLYAVNCGPFESRTGSPWRDLPERYGPYTTVYNRFNRCRKAGIWDTLMDAIVQAHGGEVQMNFTSNDA